MTCIRLCLVPKSFPSRDRKHDDIKSGPMECTDQRYWLHVSLDFYETPNFDKTFIRSSLYLTLPTRPEPVTCSFAKNKTTKFHSLSLNFNKVIFFKKITNKTYKPKFLPFFLFPRVYDNQSAVQTTEQKLTNKILLCNHRKIYPKRFQNQLVDLRSYFHTTLSRQDSVNASQN